MANNTKDIINFAILCGQIILENGGETYRAEQTTLYICKGLGIKNAECFATPTGIFLSVLDIDNKDLTIIKRITKHSINLNTINFINKISRDIYTKNINLLEGHNEIKKVKNMKIKNINLVFASAFSSAFFCLLIGGKILDGIISFICQILISLSFIYLSKYNFPSFLTSLIGGFVSAIITTFFSFFYKSINVDYILIASIVLMLPGITITNAVRDTLRGDLVSGTAGIIDSFIIAVSIAFGVGGTIKIIYAIKGVFFW